MNRLYFLATGGALVMGLNACIINNGGVDGTGGTAGTGGSTGDGAADGSGGAGGSVANGVGGGGGGGTCLGCADFASGTEGALCTESETIYDALATCSCDGACMLYCGDNLCAELESTTACDDCLLDVTNGCGNEYDACAQD